MLKFLAIENFALIDRLEIEFQKGLNLITGETGSGKSILVDAVGLLVGGRASQEMIRQGFAVARLEGIFSLTSRHPLQRRLREAGIPVEDGELIIRREISRAGVNKVFINGNLNTQGLLAELGTWLSDIHGQHDQQQLLRPAVQLEFLDVFGQNRELCDRVVGAFQALQGLQQRLRHLRSSEQDRLQRLDTLRFQLEDLERLRLTPGLDTELEEERRLLNTAEQRLQAAQQAYQALYEQEASSLSLLRAVERRVEELALHDTTFGQAVERLREVRFQLEELAYQLRDYSQSVEFNPGRLELVEERLLELQKARRKYGESVDLMLAYRDRIQGELQELYQGKEQLEELEHEERRLAAGYREQAEALSEKRRQDSETLRRRVQQELADLNMAETVFQALLERDPQQASEKGIDQVQFLISPNPGEAPLPLARIASGGELSRIVLALKSIVSLEDYPKTLVFDEVDAGIGGRVASSVGRKLARLAGEHQVFCVTHLPQIACCANQHFHVDKRQRGARTVVQITRLEGEARVEEIARMMAGRSVTETTREHARELLQRSRPRRGDIQAAR